MPELPAPGGSPRPDTRDPHRSRRRAVKLLFQADLRDCEPGEWLERVARDPAALRLLDEVWDGEPGAEAGHADADLPRAERAARRAEPPPLDGYSRRLVAGVAEHLGEIDDLLGRFSRRWPVHRMATVDRNVLRIGVYELLWEDVGAAVVIDEAVELARELSTDDSHRFVNGILEAVRQWAADTDGTADDAPEAGGG